MLGGQGAPVLLVGIGTGLALYRGDHFLDGLHGFLAPNSQRRGIGPVLLPKECFGDLEAVPAQRRALQLGVDIAGIVMFTVATEPEQGGDDQLGPFANPDRKSTRLNSSHPSISY